MKIELIRVALSETETLGVLKIQDEVQCVTLENPWVNNQRNISCIPTGLYVCKRIVSPKFKDTFEVVDVPKRTNILFHWGNTPSDTQGCVLLGSSFGILEGQRAVLASRNAFNAFLEKMKGINFFALDVRTV